MALTLPPECFNYSGFSCFEDFSKMNKAVFLTNEASCASEKNNNNKEGSC